MNRRAAKRLRGSGAATRRGFIASAAALLAAPYVAAQAPPAKWPERVIKLVVPFTPGGSTDVLARVIAHVIEPKLGQPIVIENRPGSGGVQAATAVARSDPDGYTLMMGHIGTLAFNPWLYRSLAYDPRNAFAAIAQVAIVPNILAVHAAFPATTVGELIALARGKPGTLTYGSGGNGSAAHIATAYLAHAAGLDLVHVPYRGTAPAVNDLAGGHINMMMTGGPALLPLVASGKMRALAVSSAQRVPFAPELPPLAEAAGLPGFEAVQWYGMVGPARLPDTIVQRLNGLVNEALASAEVAETLLKDGALAMPGSSEAFATLIRNDIDTWGRIIVQAGIKTG